MVISAGSAEALTSIILRSTQGEDRVQLQLPWIVEDRDECWLVRGTPFHDGRWKLTHCQFSILIRKTSAEVLGLRFDVRCDLDDVEYSSLKAELPEEALQAIGGPVLDFQPEPANIGLYGAVYGGLINTSEDAIDFVHALAQENASTASLAKSSYEASEKSGMWRIVCRSQPNPVPVHLCSFSRETGKIMSGLLLH